MEEFRDVPGFTGFQVGDKGTVLGRRGKPISQRPNHRGHPVVNLENNDRKLVGYKVSRLVACAFLGMDLHSDNEVHHRDEDKTNNCKENLEVLSLSAHMMTHFGHSEVESVEGRTCIECKTFKPLSMFYVRSNGSTRSRCKECYKALTAAQSRARALAA